MLTKIIFIFTLILLWIGLMGYPDSKVHLIYLAAAVTLVFFISLIFKVLPNRIFFNYLAFAYFFWLIKEIIKSSFAVMKLIWAKKINDTSTFEWVEFDSKDSCALSLYANSITLTPGTITLDIKDNRLLVHALEASSIEDLKKGEMAQRVKRCTL